MPAASSDHTSPSRSHSPSAVKRPIFRQDRPESRKTARAGRGRSSSLVAPLGDPHADSSQEDQQWRPPTHIESGQPSILLKSPGECDQARPKKAESHGLELNAPLKLVEALEITKKRPQCECGRNDCKKCQRVAERSMLMSAQEQNGKRHRQRIRRHRAQEILQISFAVRIHRSSPRQVSLTQTNVKRA